MHTETPDYKTTYKTAHLLIAKHGNEIVKFIKDKKTSYNNEKNKKAVSILKEVELAAINLISTSQDSDLPN